MHVHFLDPYRPRPSPVHRLDARVKLVLTLAFILSCCADPGRRLAGLYPAVRADRCRWRSSPSWALATC